MQYCRVHVRHRLDDLEDHICVLLPQHLVRHRLDDLEEKFLIGVNHIKVRHRLDDLEVWGQIGE